MTQLNTEPIYLDKIKFELSDPRYEKIDVFLRENFYMNDLISQGNLDLFDSELMKDLFGETIKDLLVEEECQLCLVICSLVDYQRTCVLLQESCVYVYSESSTFFMEFLNAWSRNIYCYLNLNKIMNSWLMDCSLYLYDNHSLVVEIIFRR